MWSNPTSNASIHIGQIVAYKLVKYKHNIKCGQILYQIVAYKCGQNLVSYKYDQNVIERMSELSSKQHVLHKLVFKSSKIIQKRF